jgi:hypothetical protein
MVEDIAIIRRQEEERLRQVSMGEGGMAGRREKRDKNRSFRGRRLILTCKFNRPFT